MQEEDIGEEMLSLDLGISSPWCSSATKKKKRKRRRDESNVIACGTSMQAAFDKKLFELLQTRERTLRLDPRMNGSEDGKDLHLLFHLLLVSATAADSSNNSSSAIDCLRELYQHVSRNGDPIQRVAAYFADGLAARLLTKGSPFYQTILAPPTPEEEFLAFTELYRASPFYQFAHFTANQAIIEAFEEEEQHNGRRLHVIDFDVSYGFQWPSLIQSLSDKATGTRPISLRITGIGGSVEELRETEMRLVSFAKGCRNLLLEFEGLPRGSARTRSDFKIEKNATLVVNLVFYLQALRSSSERSEVLMAVYSLNPSMVVVVEKEGGQGSRTFVSRFMESLHYYAAMFDSLNDCLPAESAERLRIEKNHLGREIKMAMTEEEEKEEDTWKGKMESLGFKETKLSSRSVSQAKLLLKIKSHLSSIEDQGGCGFQILERDGRAISLGWRSKHLMTVSAWHCIEEPPNHSPAGCSS